MSKELKLTEYKFKSEDHALLENYFRIAESVADLIGEHCEVVVHSLHDVDASVVKIVNGHNTQRKINSPITNLGLGMIRLINDTGDYNPRSYFTTNKDGQRLKSTTSVITNLQGIPIGLFCININTSASFFDVISTYIEERNDSDKVEEEFFSESSDEVIIRMVNTVVSEVDNDDQVTPKVRNKVIVSNLMHRGVFELKSSVHIVSEMLGITKHAVYKYLREFKSED